MLCCLVVQTRQPRTTNIKKTDCILYQPKTIPLESPLHQANDLLLLFSLFKRHSTGEI